MSDTEARAVPPSVPPSTGRAHGVGNGLSAHEWADILAEPDVLETLAIAMARGHAEQATLALWRCPPRRPVDVWKLEQLRCGCSWLQLAARLRLERLTS